MAQCGHLVSGDPARPCVVAAGHRDSHRDAAQRERQRQYREQNRERILKYRRDYGTRNQKRIRVQQHARDIRRKFSLELHEYAQIKKTQGGKCAICMRATGRTKRLAVDHCHATREIRGLLCSLCNHMLGHLRDDPAALQRAIDYLANPPARQALGRVVLVPADSPAQQPRKRRPRAPRKTG